MAGMGRRDVLRVVGTAAAAMIGLRPAYSAVRGDSRIRLHNIHTGESVNTVYRTPEGYDEAALGDIDRVLRDFRTGDVYRIDPALIDLVYALSSKVDAKHPFDVICGYRSPQTNAMLASASSGVAKRSFHMKGKAIDLCLPGFDLRDLHVAARLLRGGGVGIYPKPGFIHVDTGPVRYW
jgi:uncharacterized protein YcbK (DUF882 family)